MRIVLEILGLGLALAVVHVVLRGIQPVLPGLAGALRALLHPFVLVSVVVVVLLFRAARTRRKTRTDDTRGSTSE